MGTCRLCGNTSVTISNTIGFCADCVRSQFDLVWPEIKAVHDQSRRAYAFPTDPPRSPDGITCPLCFNQCKIAEDGIGYCGLRRVESGTIKGGRSDDGSLSFYFDPLPTNCVADFVCPAGTACGYPEFSVTPGPERGYRNLAVFYHSCSFNCLYCQNFHFKKLSFSSETVTAHELANFADDKTTCICFFGGDPSPQILHALEVSRLAMAGKQDRILRICWETNGALREPFLGMMAETSLKSGGCVKFDLKAWTEQIHYALCGVSNRATLDNFSLLSGFLRKRSDPPFLVASTLLVPGYVDETEVGGIAEFIAKLNPEIPYRLLGFCPEFLMRDLPATSAEQAFRCRDAAQRAGLTRVSIGNAHLLSSDYP
jgi:pyruvate formate lyase activating enzyme